MAHDDVRPSSILTREAFLDAIIVNAAIGGSTNAQPHLMAMARHAGVELHSSDWMEHGYDVPLLLNMQPAGKYLGERFHRAGGVPAVMWELQQAGLLHADRLTVTGQTMAANLAGRESADREMIRPFAAPLKEKAGFMALQGNLFDFAIMKTSVISPAFRERYLSRPGSEGVFEARAIVFDGSADYHARINDPALAIDDSCMLVMRGAGPVGWPGSAEVVNMQPPDALLTHGFVVDGKGHKMSKSKGNVIAPQKIFDTLGADILRLWTASTDYSGELSISDEILKRVVESYRRIRNTLKFLLANISDFDAAKDALPVQQWLEIDRYALAMTHTLQADITAAYSVYDFHAVAKSLQAFCSEDLGGFYLDILKDRLYTAGTDSSARRSAQNALYHITQALHRLMAPVLSFTAEEVHEVLSGREDASVFMGEWYELPELLEGKAITARWSELRTVRAEVQRRLEELRAAGTIGSSLQAEVDVYVTNALQQKLAVLGDDLRFVLITSAATLHGGEHGDNIRIEARSSAQAKCERCWHYRADVGSTADHPTICGRCVSNLYGAGEARQYA